MVNQTDVVSNFASLMGTKRTSKESPPAASLVKSDAKNERPRELLMCISKSVGADEVVCTLPSLDMRKLDQDPDANPLPGVGEHFPKMEASVLHNAAETSAKAAQVASEQKAVQTLGSATSWTKSSLVYASKAISENVKNSFSSLVESRVRAWTLLLLRHSLTGDSNSRSRLLSMLESIIKVNSAQIAFELVPMSTSVANTEKTVDDPDVILPILVEVRLSITVHGKACTVTLRAPGTISANFDRTEDDKIGMGLKFVDIRIDTRQLLESMVKEARMVVFNAVSKATSDSKSTSIDSNLLKGSEGMKAKAKAPSHISSGFNSSLNLSPSMSMAQMRTRKPPGVENGQHHLFMKAHNSSLKLNKVLSSATLMQKTRSVQFGTMSLNPSLNPKPSDALPKRQKLATTAKLASFKSFGRPHAGDFGSDGGPKNATFANFGGGSKKYWGRDGKLASKPRPMLPTETTDAMTSQTRRNANATFDFQQKPPIHLSRNGLGIQKTKKTNQTDGSSSTIPRTATAAEALLLHNMKGNKF